LYGTSRISSITIKVAALNLAAVAAKLTNSGYHENRLRQLTLSEVTE
jgi:hypothetical protein